MGNTRLINYRQYLLQFKLELVNFKNKVKKSQNQKNV